MTKKTAALTLIGSFLTLALFATAHGSGNGSRYERGSGYYDRGSRYEYRGNYEGRYYDDRYEYRGDRRYSDDRYEYRGNERRPIRPQAPAPANTSTDAAPATTAK